MYIHVLYLIEIGVQKEYFLLKMHVVRRSLKYCLACFVYEMVGNNEITI